MGRWLAIVALVGCGRLHFDPLGSGDGGSDAAAAVCGPWSLPVELAGVNSAAEDEWDGALSPDGNTLVFGRVQSHALYMATRTGPTSFSAPTLLGQFSGTTESTGPAWSPAGDELYFYSDPAATFHLYRSSFSGGAFGAPTIVTELSGYVVDGSAFSRDGRELYWTHLISANVAEVERATRATAADPWVYTGIESQLMTTSEGAGWPTISADGLTMYLEVQEGTGRFIGRATRATTNDHFDNVEHDPDIDAWPDVFRLGDPDLTPDGTTMLVAIDRASTTTQHDLFMTTRVCD